MKDIEKYKEIFNSPLVEAIERELIWTIQRGCQKFAARKKASA